MKEVSKTLRVALVIISIVGAIYGFGKYIDGRIERAVRDEEFIKKVASRVRPYVIFDASEVIHVDGGAMEYINGIKVDERLLRPWAKMLEPMTIIVTPKQHLKYGPLLEHLGIYDFYVSSKRGKRHEWVYKLVYLGGAQLGEEERKVPILFRLEILQ